MATLLMQMLENGRSWTCKKSGAEMLVVLISISVTLFANYNLKVHAIQIIACKKCAGIIFNFVLLSPFNFSSFNVPLRESFMVARECFAMVQHSTLESGLMKDCQF